MPNNIIKRYPDALVKQMHHTNQTLCLDMVQKILKRRGSSAQIHHQKQAGGIFPANTMAGGGFERTPLRNKQAVQYLRQNAQEIVRWAISPSRTEKIHFGWKCIMCMRCVLYCPNDAIKFGLIDLLAFNGPYDFERILCDAEIPDNFINEKTKGFFRMFKKYYRWAGEICKKH